MIDKFSTIDRTRIMRSVGPKNTEPEMRVRRALHRAGFRYSLHKKTLPGKPDILLPKYKSAVFVHGCFWHGHACTRGKRPATNIAFWNKKIDRNIERDGTDQDALRQMGWSVFVLWGCTLDQDTYRLIRSLAARRVKGTGLAKTRKIRIERPKRHNR